MLTVAMSYNARRSILDCAIVGEHSTLELEGFTQLKREGIPIIAEDDTIASQHQAYNRYAREVVRGLRGEAPLPVMGAEILPVMKELQRMHDCAATWPSEKAVAKSTDWRMR
jgi:hypothetical protein